MNPAPWPSASRCLAAFAVALGLAAVSTAQQPAPIPPLYPTLNMPFPMGVQRGTTLELNLTGTNLAEPTTVWTSIPGAKVTIPTENNNGKDNGKLKVVLEVPKEAPLGFHALRVATTRGPSNLRLFCVDDLPQLVADGKNHSKSAAQSLPVPCVVAGTIAAESSDWYKITVQAGQRLSFEVIGRRLGGPLDPQMAIIDPRSGKEIAFSNDALGLQTDSRLTHTFTDAGEYLIELRDVLHRGGADYVYRLRVGDFPCATTPIPMAAKRGSQVQVNFAGTMVENVAPVAVTVPADPAVDTVWVAPRGANGLHGWPVALAVSDLDEVVEQEPNNEPAKANRIPVPGAVTGRFQDKGDIDHYMLPLKKGRYVIEAHTQELNSPTEVYMVLKDAKGGELLRTDPQKPPRLDFTAPADGDYVLAVEQLLNAFGPVESYRISVVPTEPGFDVGLVLDRFAVPQGSAAVIGLTAPVRRDYNGPIEVSVVGPPGVSGQTTLVPGAAAPPPAKPVPNQPAALLFVSAGPEAAMGLHNVKVRCQATINGKLVTSYATVRIPVSQALSGLPFPPRQLMTEVALAVTEKPPFTLTARFDQPEALRGTAANLTITATRAPGFDDEIVLTPLGLPANVAPVLKNIPKGMNEVKAQLTPAATVPFGSHSLSFNGKAKFQNKEFNVVAAPVVLLVAPPFELKVEPEKLALDLGGKAKLKVVAVRKGGYQGPITLQLRNLPANVTAPAAKIEMGQDAAEIEVTAAANAAVGDKADVNVLGTAPAAANQQNASANFTVSVVKK
jgi:hypothetical protein